MSNNTGFFTCKNICWIIGALLGFAVFLMISGFIGLIVGIIVAVVAAILLQKWLCGEVVDTRPARGATTAASLSGSTATSTSAPDASATGNVAAAAADIPAAAMDGAPVPAEETPAPAPKAATPKPVAKKTAAKKTAAKRPAAKKPAAKASSATKTSTAKAPAAKAAKPASKPAAKAAKPASKAPAKTAAVAAPTGKPKKPRTLKAPRKSGADDLKQLKGVGPKLEQTLNTLGFWHFDQVAKWGPDEISWVDDNLSFKGRIERDGWVDQAKTLAEGGETAFSKKVKKGDVY
ncbi:NADH:quinone oxidoreductase [Aliiroseovarius sp. M344]|uniref:NADH:quinone oxidoreductase n=1 Tax=Aliiroseovarius sp. M344 TaxID=2867010 RepID=UPI0021AD686E|nr:NADH:quinone oxidoreductase [Aliiroseovarius sp. M344]UWQ13326.1 NADH:quinone oxidoreductase [Aliiroseovarius sp. M344]